MQSKDNRLWKYFTRCNETLEKTVRLKIIIIGYISIPIWRGILKSGIERLEIRAESAIALEGVHYIGGSAGVLIHSVLSRSFWLGNSFLFYLWNGALKLFLALFLNFESYKMIQWTKSEFSYLDNFVGNYRFCKFCRKNVYYDT